MKTKFVKFPFYGEDYEVAFVIEREEPLALVLYNKAEDGDWLEPFCDVSINSLSAGKDTCYVKNYSENKGLDKWLYDMGFAVPTGRISGAGYGVPEMRFDLKKIKEFSVQEDDA